MAKQKDYKRPELRSTKRQKQVLTKTPKKQAISAFLTSTRTLKTLGRWFRSLLPRATFHSTLDPNAGNDHIVLLEAYKVIGRA